MRGLNLLAGVVLVLYPLMVYLGMQWFEPAVVVMIVVGIDAVLTLVNGNQHMQRGGLIMDGADLAAVFWYINSELLLRLLPAGINLSLALVVAAGLIWPPMVPARMAALHRGVPYSDLPPPVRHYTSWVTRLWVVFFVFNAGVSVLTAWVGSREL